MNNKQNQVSLFYSYSHKDETLRDTLETHLSILARNGVISQWHDRRILAGSEWESEINNQIEAADIILLLVSPDFIASDYCYGNELVRAIERHESNQSIVIPVVVRPVDWSDAPFSKLQALPKDAQAVTSWNNQDEAWLSVAKGVREAVEEVAKLKTRRGEESGLLSIRELLAAEVDQIDEAFHKDGEMTTSRGLSTGLTGLDSITDGLHNSEFVVVASRPGMGKTDLVLGVAAHAAIKEKRAVAYFSLNLPADRIARRLIASLGRVSSYRLLRGTMNDQDWPRLTSAVSILADVPLYIDESLSLTLPLLKEKLERIRKEQGLELVIIDSLQHLAFQAQSEGVQSSNVSLAKGIKTLAKEFQIPILVTTTISPEVESRPNKRPVFRDLDEMRGVEDDADTIIFVYRDEVYDEDTIDRGIAELIVAKNSEGPIGTVRVTYLQEYARFENFVPDPHDF